MSRFLTLPTTSAEPFSGGSPVHSLDQPEPTSFIKPEHYQPPPAKTPSNAASNQAIGPAAYDTGITPGEGLMHRRGWAGP